MADENQPLDRRATTATLLLTDVVDSTKLSVRLGDTAMADLWARHDRAARDLLPLHGGREIDKTDGFLMLFDEVSDAVAYAVAYHRALGELGIVARAGLHVGDVILTENMPEDVARGAKPLEVDGIAKPIAARTMSIALGGQTLLTPAAVAALGDTDLRLESHGHWRMKGVSEPIELFEVGDEAAPFQPPPDASKVYRVVERDGLWLPVREVRHSLPAERDTFVGRTSDLKALAHLLEEGRLVSVLGIGGTGKTRLVTRFGWAWLGDFAGGVWFCDLSEARSVDSIVTAVAQALDVPLSTTDPVVQLGHALAGRGPCLVILDNFEQVARFASDTVGSWLDRARDARFVVTTREVLGLRGETVLPLQPLVDGDSAELFAARARQAVPGFEPTDHESIASLVELLDHLPLAIELAAARVRVMPPRTLLERMSQRFKLLASRSGRSARQATLRGALDWSWDLLEPDEQAALAQLSVFEGGFTLDAAEVVLALEDLWATDAVQALVDKSLVQHLSDERFGLLVSVHEYASEQLDDCGGRTQAELRHGRWCAGLGAGQPMHALREAAQVELDNVVAACRRAVLRGDGAVAGATCVAACSVLQTRGPLSRASSLVRRVLEMPDLDEIWRARAVLNDVVLARLQGRQADLTGLERGLTIARAHGDRELEASVLHRLGVEHQLAGRMDDAVDHLTQAATMARDHPSPASEAWPLIEIGNIRRTQGRLEDARASYEGAIRAARASGDDHAEGSALGSLAVLLTLAGHPAEETFRYHRQVLASARASDDLRRLGRVLLHLAVLYMEHGREQEARDCYDESLVVARELGDRLLECYATGNLGALLARQGRLDEASDAFEQAYAIACEVADRKYQGILLGNLGALRVESGRADEAMHLLRQALDVHRELGNRRSEGKTLGTLGNLLWKAGRETEGLRTFDEATSLLRDIGATFALGTTLCQRAKAIAARHPDAARAAVAEAQDLAERIGAGPESELRQLLAEAHAVLRDPIPPDERPPEPELDT